MGGCLNSNHKIIEIISFLWVFCKYKQISIKKIMIFLNSFLYDDMCLLKQSRPLKVCKNRMHFDLVQNAEYNVKKMAGSKLSKSYSGSLN